MGLEALKAKQREFHNTPRLQALLNWAEQATTRSAGDLKPVGKRAVAIANAYTYALAYAYA
ncbi:MAG: hypothetical protein C6Y22_14405 [Hapalosiphonaceae cyanobacterium JJU2]|nr:MAG: hypothetical protein C6Y22_14405 [Hapalosiphonaceae cyanobacterium JJU2]